jgi:hypothetical protein
MMTTGKAVLFWMVALIAPTAVWAQAGTPAETKAEMNARAEALAKQTQNPVADLVSIPFQFNWNTGGGLGDQTLQVINIQPVLPLALDDDWLLVSRTIVPLVNVPLPSGARSTGIGDIQEQMYLTASKPGSVIWGFGPVFSFPTATNDALTTGQFALGPDFVILTMPGKWVLGAVANQLWRIGGSDNTTAISSFFVQPFVNYNLHRGWSLSTSPSITADWNAPSGQQWTVPLGMGVSKVSLIGKQPVNLSLQYYHNVVRPDNGPADVVRMVFGLLYPVQRPAR